MNPILEQSDFLSITVSRQEVELVDTSVVMETLRELISSQDVARKFQEKVAISIDGYNQDHRELFEIPEVRNYIYKLDDEFPFWLFFLSKHFSGLQFILLCFLPPFLTNEAKANIFPEKIGNLLEKHWIPAMNQVAGFVGLGEDKIMELTDRALQYITNGPL